MDHDTIVAQLTPFGRSGVGIIRVSGSQSKNIAYHMLGKIPKPRYACYSNFLNYTGCIIDQGLALWFPKPLSFTGEDVLELQCHGNPVILDLLIKCILSFDKVRVARPGEFSERAFLNGKIDLIQAESIMELIHSNSELSVKSAMRSLQGLFSNYINDLIISIKELRVLIEAVINFPDENISIKFHDIEKYLLDFIDKISNIFLTAKSGNIIREGIKISIVGNSNSGKSSIFNALLLSDLAIVTNIQGTTRDLLHENIYIDGLMFQITDTAGFRETDDIVEKIGINKSFEQIKLSNHVFFVVDDTISSIEKKKIINCFLSNFSKINKVTILFNKIDLLNKKPCVVNYMESYASIYLSAKTGDGINLLRNYLKQLSCGILSDHSGSVFLARNRHIKILQLINDRLKLMKKNWSLLKNFELLAEDLKIIQDLLNQIIGVVTSEDILNSIFSDFCIGK